MDRDRASAAVVRRRLVSLVGFPLSIALALSLSLSFLVATSHLFMLLNGTVSLIHFAVVRRSAAAAVKVLIVHADLELGGGKTTSAKGAR